MNGYVNNLLRKKVPTITYKDIQNKEGIYLGRPYFKTAKRYMDSSMVNDEVAVFEPETFTLTKENKNKYVEMLEKRVEQYYENYQDVLLKINLQLKMLIKHIKI